ncbi:MAG: DsbA family protein [Alphaproteobacteria bacterium]|nr:DsbA family protein [Alphaproteobacteria bacterium]USO07644.1 MAG: DsbA family protein [Rhodospirillales bacterium]
MRKKILLFTIPLILLIAAGGAYSLHSKPNPASETAGDFAEQGIADNAVDNAIAPATGDVQKADTPTPEGTSATTTLPPAADSAEVTDADIHITADGMDPKAPKSIGRSDAPVTMTEYSSLTCPHCGHAHETILPRLIKEYVETGKLRIVFNDFPLNQQAMDASKVSRCVAGDQYFGFLTMLFGSIEQWAYSNNHPQALLQDAVLAGLPEDRAKACLADTEIEKAIIAGVQQAISKYNIQATPTFVFNDGKKIISGAQPYTVFQSTIDGLLAGGGDDAAPAPEKAPDTTPVE